MAAHYCVQIAQGNCLSPIWRQAIIWTNVESSLFEALGLKYNLNQNNQTAWKRNSFEKKILCNGGHFVQPSMC